MAKYSQIVETEGREEGSFSNRWSHRKDNNNDERGLTTNRFPTGQFNKTVFKISFAILHSPVNGFMMFS